MGGRKYSDDELNKIGAYIDLNPNTKDIDVARQLLMLGIIKNRTVNGVAQQVRILKSPSKEGSDEMGNQIEWDAYESFVLKKELKEIKEKYESLLAILIDEAEIKTVEKTTATYKNLYFNLIKLNEWVRENEPERFMQKLEEAEEEQ